MTEKQMLAAIVATHDQDEAEGRDWFASLDNTSRVRLWLFLNKNFEDPLEEAMSRLAILQFEAFFLEMKERTG